MAQVSFAPRRAPALLRTRRFSSTTCVNLRQRRRQRGELLLPVFRVAIQPDGRFEQRPDFEAAAIDASAALLLHEARAHQHLNVPRDRLQGNVERTRKLRHQQRLPIETLQDSAADGIAERSEYLVELRLFGGQAVACSDLAI